MAVTETKIIYHIDDEDTPYLVKIQKAPDQVNLLDLKNALDRQSHKYFFKSMDDDFGVVKEEISNDQAILPCFNGRVVCWVYSSAESFSDRGSDTRSITSAAERGNKTSKSAEGHGVTDTESVVSHVSNSRRSSKQKPTSEERYSRRSAKYDSEYDTTSIMSSELDATSFVDSDEESRYSTTTDGSHNMSRHRKQRRRHRMPKVERCSSFSTITESTMSLNVIKVTLNMDRITFLGISIVGQANRKGDGGIYVGSVMKGGAVDADGRIQPGDMILAVNDVSLENMTNDDAVRVLREVVGKQGPISLTVAKAWDPTPKGYYGGPQTDPVRPIDPQAWIQHSEAMRGFLARSGGSASPSMTSMNSTTSSSLTSSIPESERFVDHPDGTLLGLSIHTDMTTIVKAMLSPDSGLEVRDRMWLKITIPNAFIGSDLVDWLYTHVDGFVDRREARKYASALLKAGFVRHTVNKITFSEQCYYVFGDLCGNMASLSLNEVDFLEEQDTLAPLPISQSAAWPVANPQFYPSPYFQAPPGYDPATVSSGQYSPYHQSYYTMQSVAAASNHSGPHSVSSGGGATGGGSVHGSSGGIAAKELDTQTLRSSGSSERSASSSGRSELRDQRARDADSISIRSQNYGRLDAVPASVSGSRQSFRVAMGNPMEEFFVDVM